LRDSGAGALGGEPVLDEGRGGDDESDTTTLLLTEGVHKRIKQAVQTAEDEGDDGVPIESPVPRYESTYKMLCAVHAVELVVVTLQFLFVAGDPMAGNTSGIGLDAIRLSWTVASFHVVSFILWIVSLACEDRVRAVTLRSSSLSSTDGGDQPPPTLTMDDGQLALRGMYALVHGGTERAQQLLRARRGAGTIVTAVGVFSAALRLVLIWGVTVLCMDVALLVVRSVQVAKLRADADAAAGFIAGTQAFTTAVLVATAVLAPCCLMIIISIARAALCVRLHFALKRPLARPEINMQNIVVPAE
jgi:hypothetical protein